MNVEKQYAIISMDSTNNNNCDLNRKYTLLAQENRRITDIKIFDNTTQSSVNICYDEPCPGLTLATPNGCACICGNDFDLNSSATKCLPQATKNGNNCESGKLNEISNCGFRFGIHDIQIHFICTETLCCE